MEVRYDGNTTIVSGNTVLVEHGTQLRICNEGRVFGGGIVGAENAYRAVVFGNLTGLIEVRVDHKTDDTLLDSIVFGVDDAADDDADEPAKMVVKRPAKAAATKKK